MATFQFDDIVDSTLESIRAKCEKLTVKKDSDYISLVDKLSLPTTNKQVWTNLFLVKLIYNLLWHAVALMIGSKAKGRERLTDIRKKALLMKDGMSKRWWEKTSFSALMDVVNDASDSKWYTLKRLIVAQV